MAGKGRCGDETAGREGFESPPLRFESLMRFRHRAHDAHQKEGGPQGIVRDQGGSPGIKRDQFCLHRGRTKQARSY